MLGLDRTNHNSALIKSHSIVRATLSELDPLCLAFHYALRFGYTASTLHQRYGLRKATLSDIKNGRTIRHNRELYQGKIVLALCECRLREIYKGNLQKADEILMALGEVAMVLCSVSTDAELVNEALMQDRKTAGVTARRYGYDLDLNRLRETLSKA